MKKCILVAAIALLSSPVLMAEVQMKAMVLDSMVYEGAGGKDKTEYAWTASGNQLSETRFQWDDITNAWAPSSRMSWTYDANGNEISKLYEHYDTKWVNDQQFTREYDEDGNMTVMIQKQWNISTEVWDNVKRDKYTYNGDGNVVLYLNGGWDTGKWIDYDRTAYEYNAQGLLTLEVNSYLDLGTGVYVTSWHRTYAYNANNKLKEVIEESWVSDAWLPYTKETFGYDADGNMSENVKYSYNTSISDWEPTTRWVWGYNTDGQLEVQYVENWDTSIPDFVPSNKQEYTYNAYGYEELVKYADWDGADWAYYYKHETVYLEGTNYVKKTLDYNWVGGIFVNTGFGTYYYHEQATAIDRVAAQSANTVKVIRNGQVLILRDGKTFDLNGKVVE